MIYIGHVSPYVYFSISKIYCLLWLSFFLIPYDIHICYDDDIPLGMLYVFCCDTCFENYSRNKTKQILLYLSFKSGKNAFIIDERSLMYWSHKFKLFNKTKYIQTSSNNRHTITTPTMMKSSMILSFSKFAFLVVLIASTTTAIASASSTTESSSLRGGNGVSTSRGCDGNTRTVPICRQWRLLEVVDVVGANYIVRYGQPVGSYEGNDDVDDTPLPNSRLKRVHATATPTETMTAAATTAPSEAPLEAPSAGSSIR